MDPIFSITQEKRKNEIFLVVKILDKETNENLKLSEIKKDKTLLPIVELILSNRSFEEEGASFFISSKSLFIMQKLIASKRLFWKNRSLFFNPLSRAEVFLEAEFLVPDGLFLSGGVALDGVFYEAEAIDFLFPAFPIWGICKQVVFCLPRETKFFWLAPIYEKGQILSKEESRKFVKEVKEDPPEGFPKVSWKGEFSLQKTLVLPVLILKDRYGAFADLYMDYEGKLIDFFVENSLEERDRESEKLFEQDLLETGFLRKRMPSSSYYCPMDHVAKSLSFLWEIGWKIQDAQGRLVFSLTESKIDLSTKGEGLLLRGSLQYGAHKVALTDVVGAFMRRDSFIEISPGIVGWLGGPGYEGIQALMDTEVTKEGCFFSKRNFGFLESFQ